MTYTFVNKNATRIVEADNDEMAYTLLRAYRRDDWLDYSLVSVDVDKDNLTEVDYWDEDDSHSEA